MEAQRVLHIIQEKLYIIVLVTIITSLIVLVVSLNMTPIYQAKVVMIVAQTKNALTSDYASSLSGENLALTYSRLLTTRPLLEIVINNLDLDIAPEDLRENMLDINLVQGTQLLELSIEDTNPQRASDIANEIVYNFIALRNPEQQLQSIKALEQDVVSQMNTLKALIDRGQSTTSNLSSGLLTDEELALTQSTLSNQQLTYARLMDTYLSIRLAESQLLDITVVEPAIPPEKPIRPVVPLYVFLGAAIGFTFSSGLVFLIAYFDRSFKTSNDVKQVLSLPALGTIYKLSNKKQNNGIVTLSFPTSPVAEAYRTLRTNIRFASFDASLKSLLITSAEPGTGKTTIVANLGIVFAQTGINVILIDSDLRSSKLHHLFHLDNQRGLVHFLTGDVHNIMDCISETSVANLRLITSGGIPPNPSELLSSERMRIALSEVQSNAELVILDTPPTLAVADALNLASMVDSTVLLIEAEKTSCEAACKLYEAHQHVGTKLLGFVLTKAKLRAQVPYPYYSKTLLKSMNGANRRN
ncbi:MAG: polysaccharide biosynthesis tyrosine autokinase [Anaerolineae bacterium]|nr:polysaccharide biosynthesis tyrosine autokinase [Anaerolineae bacterium]